MKKIVLITAIALFTNSLQAQVTNGLVAKYSFNSGNANDEVGTNNGTVNGANLTSDRFGNVNKAFNFINGDYITLPDAPVLKSAIMTVSLWVKIDSFAQSNVLENYIYSVVNSTTNAYFAAFAMGVYTPDGKYLNVNQNGPAESALGFSNNAKTSSWQHYVMSIDNDSLKMFIDGQLQWSLFKGFVTTFTMDSVYIGKSGNTTYYGNLNGSVDDLRIYNRVLTNIEVDSLFNEIDPLTSIDKNTHENIALSIYPNPSHSKIQVKVSSPTTILITNIVGQELLNAKVQNLETIDVSSFENGIYFVKDLNTGKSYKFVKQ